MKYYVAGIEFSSENALMHHGIKGQKWGVRRFQNQDGTYTEAGKERYRGSRPSSQTRLPKNVDFSHIKNKKEKATKELKLLRMNDVWEDHEDHTEKEWDDYLTLLNAVYNVNAPHLTQSKKVKETYEKGKNCYYSRGYKPWGDRDKMPREVREDIDKELEKLKTERSSAILQEIGYEDTPEARRALNDWQDTNLR